MSLLSLYANPALLALDFNLFVTEKVLLQNVVNVMTLMMQQYDITVNDVTLTIIMTSKFNHDAENRRLLAL